MKIKLLKMIAVISVLCLAAALICINVFADDDSIIVCKHTAEIIGANVSLDADISLRYYVKLCDCYKDAKMVFTSSGMSVKKAAYYDVETEEYVFTLDNIRPQTIGDLIDAELVVGGRVIASKEGYSVLENCKKLLSRYPNDEKMQYLIKALLSYCASVQNYKEYKVDDPVNAGYEIDLLRPGLSDSVKEIINKDGDAVVDAANISFETEVKIFIKVLCEYEPTVTIDGVEVKAEIQGDGEENYNSGLWVFYTDGISPDKFNDTIRFVITSNDPNTELLYSVNSYAYSKREAESTSMRNLSTALYTYGIAMENYLAQ